MSKIYIPQYLKKIPIISKFYNLLSAYEEENSMRTIDTYIVGNLNEVIEQKKEDPVYYFIWNIIENNYKNFSISYRNNLVTYLTKLFYSVKGTYKVFDFMESKLSISFSLYPTFENGNIKFQLKDIVDFNENASTNFSQAIKNFLSRLLYFRESEEMYETVTITVTEVFKYEINNDLIQYKVFTILLNDSEIKEPESEEEEPEEPEQEPELNLFQICSAPLVNNKVKILFNYGPWDLFDGFYLADNDQGTNSIKVDTQDENRVYSFPESTSDSIYLFVEKKDQDPQEFWGNVFETEHQTYSRLGPVEDGDGYTIILSNNINYIINQYNIILQETETSIYFRYKLFSNIDRSSVSNYIKISGPSLNQTVSNVLWLNENNITVTSLQRTVSSDKPEEHLFSIGFSNIPVNHSIEAADWVENYMNDKEVEYTPTSETISGEDITIHNFLIKYKN